ncbi:MAG: hypothetical protein J6P20_10235, partial [Oscillospiraceae bacterium]|nr:hypothetical protein [Oscillospiraceae bacterium]
GERKDIGHLKKEDIVAYVDFNSTLINKVGKQTLPIKVRLANTEDGTELKFTATPSVKNIEVELDRFEQRYFNVGEINHKQLERVQDVIVEEEGISCEPNQVLINGPTTALDQIDHIRLIVTDNEPISESKTYTNISDYELIGKNGQTISKDGYKVQTARFSVSIPVYYMKVLPMTVTLVGVPKDFDQDWLYSRLRINSDDVYCLPGYGENVKTIALRTDNSISKETMSRSEAWSIGKVPLSKLTLGGSGYTLTVNVGDGFKDMSNLETVRITLDETDLKAVTRYIYNKEIQPMNGLPDLKYIIAPGRTAITLIGPSDEISQISENDLQASVELANSGISDAGAFSQAVSVTLPDTAKHVWIAPTPMVSVTAVVQDKNEEIKGSATG